MPPAEIIRRAAGYLERHGVESPVPTAERLLSHVLGTDRAGIYARDGLTSQEAKLFGRALCRRCVGEPLQHVTGEQGFRRIVLRVRPGVFVPGRRRRSWSQSVLDALTPIAAPMVVDVATGSRCRRARRSPHERPEATVFATDLSPEAVALARENADALGLGGDGGRGRSPRAMPAELRGRLDAVVAIRRTCGHDARDSLPADVLAEPAWPCSAGSRSTSDSSSRLPGGSDPEGSWPSRSRRAPPRSCRRPSNGKGSGTSRCARISPGGTASSPRDGPRSGDDAAPYDVVSMTPLGGPLRDAAVAAGRGELIVFPTDTVYGLGDASRRSLGDRACVRGETAAAGPRAPGAGPDGGGRAVGRGVRRAGGAARRRRAGRGRSRSSSRGARPRPGGTSVATRRPSASAPRTIRSRSRSSRGRARWPSRARTAPVASPPAETCDELHRCSARTSPSTSARSDRLDGVASTVLDLAHGPASILREGTLSREAIAELLPDEPALLDSPPSR